jgi:hypothetical protein
LHPLIDRSHAAPAQHAGDLILRQRFGQVLR